MLRLKFTLAGVDLARFAAAYSLIAQFGLYVHQGYGQMITGLAQLFG